MHDRPRPVAIQFGKPSQRLFRKGDGRDALAGEFRRSPGLLPSTCAFNLCPRSLAQRHPTLLRYLRRAEDCCQESQLASKAPPATFQRNPSRFLGWARLYGRNKSIENVRPLGGSGTTLGSEALGLMKGVRAAGRTVRTLRNPDCARGRTAGTSELRLVQGGVASAVDQMIQVPAISVIIACRNGAATLGETLEGLAAQAWDRPWEVVLADNGSTDGTRALFEGFARRSPGWPMRARRCLRRARQAIRSQHRDRGGPRAGGRRLRCRRRAWRGLARGDGRGARKPGDGRVPHRLRPAEPRAGSADSRGTRQHERLEELTFLPATCPRRRRHHGVPAPAGPGDRRLRRAPSHCCEDTEFSLRAQTRRACDRLRSGRGDARARPARAQADLPAELQLGAATR